MANFAGWFTAIELRPWTGVDIWGAPQPTPMYLLHRDSFITRVSARGLSQFNTSRKLSDTPNEVFLTRSSPCWEVRFEICCEDPLLSPRLYRHQTTLYSTTPLTSYMVDSAATLCGPKRAGLIVRLKQCPSVDRSRGLI